MRVSLASSSRRSIMASTSLLSAARLARVLVVASLPLAAMTFAPAAFAQDAASQDIAQARQLGQQAQAAFDAGNFAESEKLWTAAAKLYSLAPTLTLGLARTQAKLGHVVAAQESYNKIIREWGNNPSPPPAFKDALEAAKAEVGAVSAKVASVTLTVEGPTNPVVTIDGQTVPVAALGLKRPVDPGSHKVSATAAGFNPAETTFEVPEGGTSAATLKMEKAPAGADTAGKGSSNKTLAYVAFGVGGAGLLVGGITGILALGKAGDLSDKCPDKKCTSDQQSDVDSYKSMGTISTVGFIVAGVGGAAGLILLLTAPSGSATGSSGSSRFATVKTPTNGGVSMTPYFGGTSAGLSGRF
jgi:tetratricopeptide (TPR) repeat protein